MSWRLGNSIRLRSYKVCSIGELTNDGENINRGWVNIRENIKTSATGSLGQYEFEQHKHWFDEECLSFLKKRKQVKMQWLQGPNQSNIYNLNNVRREAYRHFRSKWKEYLQAKIHKLGPNSKIKKKSETCRGASMTLRRVISLELIQ